MEEEWKQIEDYTDYSVSNLGNVRSNRKMKLLKLCLDTSGRPFVNIYNKKGRLTRQIARLIAIAFIPNPTNLPIIDHINRNVLDNRIENLRWCSWSENNFNRIQPLGKTSKYKGVSLSREGNWRAVIKVNSKTNSLGTFKTELEGAKAYNDFIVAHNLGEFAILNNLGN